MSSTLLAPQLALESADRPARAQEAVGGTRLSPGPGWSKGAKSLGPFEVWHHHARVRTPAELALMMQFDRRR